MVEAPPPVAVSDLSWLLGRWQATIPGLPNDCPVEPQDLVSVLDFLPPWGGTLPGIWRLGPNHLTLLAIREIDQTLEWTQQEFSASVEPRPDSSPLVYRLHSRERTSAVFGTVGAVTSPGVRALRMEWSLTEHGKLRLKFFRLSREGTWDLAREALHDPAPAVEQEGVHGTPGGDLQPRLEPRVRGRRP